MSRPVGRPGRAVAASEKAYRALLRAYPAELRAGYGREMERCFGDLCRREEGRRGVPGLLLLWARTLPELLVTALKERSAMIARNVDFPPFAPTTEARLGAVAALVGGLLGIGYYLTWAVLEATVFGDPSYYLSGPFLDLFSVTGFLAAHTLCVLGLFGLRGAVVARAGTRAGRAPGSGFASAGGAAGAVAVASFLALGGYEIAKGLAAWPSVSDAGWHGWELRLVNTLGVAGFSCWLGGLLLVGVAASRAGLPRRLRVLPFVAAALWPAGFAASALLLPDYYGLNGLGAGNDWYAAVSALSSVLPYAGFSLVGLALLKDRGASAEAPAFAAASRAAGGGPMVGRAARFLGAGRAADAGAHSGGAREKELLVALRRHGELTVAVAALETSLTVEEADRMLSDLAVKGHLEVRVERGRMLYSLWEGGG